MLMVWILPGSEGIRVGIQTCKNTRWLEGGILILLIGEVRLKLIAHNAESCNLMR